jgi:hypothetical protein
VSRRGRTGVSMGSGLEVSDRKLAELREQRRREQQAWAKRNGPVERSYLACPDCGEPHDRREACP